MWRWLEKLAKNKHGWDFEEVCSEEIELESVLKLESVELFNIVKIETQVLDLRSVTQLKSLLICNSSSTLEVYFLGLGCLRNLVYLDLSKIRTDSAFLQEEIASLTNLQVLDVRELCHKTKSGRFTSQLEEWSMAQKRGGEGCSVGQSTGNAAGGNLTRENGESRTLVGAEQQLLAKGTGNLTCKDSLEVEEQALTKSLSAGNIRVVQQVSSSLDLNGVNLLRDVCFYYFEGVDMILGLNSRMTGLKHLDLNSCSWLRSCHGVGDLVALEVLDLAFCFRLEEVPNVGRLKNLLILRVSWCESIEAVPGLGDLVSLQVFDANFCDKSAELPGMRKLVNLRILDVLGCPLIEAMPNLSYFIGLEKLFADFVGLTGCRDLLELEKLEKVEIRGWSAGGIPWLSDLCSLKSLTIRHAQGVDELTFVSNSTRLQELRIKYCGFKGVPCLSNLIALRCIRVDSCNMLERLPHMHKLSRLDMLEIPSCGSLREWERGSGPRQFGGDICYAGALFHVLSLSLRHVALMELPDLSRFSKLRKLQVDYCEKLTSLTDSAPFTALENIFLKQCGIMRALRSQLDLNDLVSPRSFKL